MTQALQITGTAAAAASLSGSGAAEAKPGGLGMRRAGGGGTQHPWDLLRPKGCATPGACAGCHTAPARATQAASPRPHRWQVPAPALETSLLWLAGPSPTSARWGRVVGSGCAAPGRGARAVAWVPRCRGLLSCRGRSAAAGHPPVRAGGPQLSEGSESLSNLARPPARPAAAPSCRRCWRCWWPCPPTARTCAGTCGGSRAPG